MLNESAHTLVNPQIGPLLLNTWLLVGLSLSRNSIRSAGSF